MTDGTGLQLRSLLKKSGQLELSLAEVPIPEPQEELPANAKASRDASRYRNRAWTRDADPRS